MSKILIVEDALAVRKALSDTLLMKGYSLFQAENESNFIEDTEKDIHTEVLHPCPVSGLAHFKSEIKNKKILEIINNPVGLILNNRVFKNFMHNEFYHKYKHNSAK
tara:strand:- start:647 stop:964 length:318 start_codon:yes stop_codon:yes gene_type:complete